MSLSSVRLIDGFSFREVIQFHLQSATMAPTGFQGLSKRSSAGSVARKSNIVDTFANYESLIEDLKNELKEAMKEIEDLTAKNGSSEEETKELKKKLLNLQNELDVVQQQLEDTEEVAKTSEKCLKDVQGQAKAAEDNLKRQLAQANESIETLKTNDKTCPLELLAIVAEKESIEKKLAAASEELLHANESKVKKEQELLTLQQAYDRMQKLYHEEKEKARNLLANNGGNMVRQALLDASTRECCEAQGEITKLNLELGKYEKMEEELKAGFEDEKKAMADKWNGQWQEYRAGVIQEIDEQKEVWKESEKALRRKWTQAKKEYTKSVAREKAEATRERDRAISAEKTLAKAQATIQSMRNGIRCTKPTDNANERALAAEKALKQAKATIKDMQAKLDVLSTPDMSQKPNSDTETETEPDSDTENNNSVETLEGKSIDELRAMDWKVLYNLIPKVEGKEYSKVEKTQKKLVNRFLQNQAKEGRVSHLLDFQTDIQGRIQKGGHKAGVRLVKDRVVSFVNIKHAKPSLKGADKPTSWKLSVHGDGDTVSYGLLGNAKLKTTIDNVERLIYVDGHPWFAVKKSLIPGAGWGLFALRKFDKRECMGLLAGELIPHGQVISESNRDKLISDEAGNSYVPRENTMYMGLQFANDASSGKTSFENNAAVDGNLLTYCTEEIEVGDEVYFEHKWKKNWSKKKKRVSVSATAATSQGTNNVSAASQDGDNVSATAATSQGTNNVSATTGKRKPVDPPADLSPSRAKKGKSAPLSQQDP